MRTRFQLFWAGNLCLCAFTSALAAPYELTVYSDDQPALGETELETIFSLARPSRRTGLTGRVGQALAELSYGVAENWSVGVELPAVYADQRRKFQGFAVEAQYVAPRDKTSHWFWGLRGGVGRANSLYEDDNALSLEVNPIIGYRGAAYRVVFNPSMERTLSGNERLTRFHPSAKWAVRASANHEIGLEYYGDWGNVRALLPPSMRHETLYVVLDKKTSFAHLNLGLGQALRPISGSVDKWVAKAGLQFEID